MASSPPGQGHARPAARDRDRDRDNRDRDRDRESHREQRDRDVSKKSSNGPSAKQRGSSPVDLPPNWETRVSRTNGDVYYYNRETYESTRVLPSSSSASAPGRQRRRHSRSPGPASSDAHHSQPSRSARDRDSSHRDRDRTRHDRHDRERDARDREAAEGSTRSATPDLTHRDRYHRPEAAPESDMSVDVVRTEHTEIISARMSPRIRYEGSPSPPPLTRPSRRARSLSPLPAQDSARNSHARAAPARDRGRDRDFEYNNRSSAAGAPARDRDTGRLAVRENRDRDRDRHKERNYTNSDSSMSRDRDLELEAADYSDRHWNAAPPADLPNQRQRGARRQDDALIDSRPSDNIQGRERDRNARPPLRHSESSRGLRDREPPRQADRRERGGELEREQREQQQYMPTQTQSTFSASYHTPCPPTCTCLYSYLLPTTMCARFSSRPSMAMAGSNVCAPPFLFSSPDFRDHVDHHAYVPSAVPLASKVFLLLFHVDSFSCFLFSCFNIFFAFFCSFIRHIAFSYDLFHPSLLFVLQGIGHRHRQRTVHVIATKGATTKKANQFSLRLHQQPAETESVKGTATIGPRDSSPPVRLPR